MDAPKTIGKAAEAAGITYSTLRYYVKRGVIENYVPGETDWEDWLGRLNAYRSTVTVGPNAAKNPKTAEASSNAMDARARWELARAEKLELENERKRGDLLSRADVLFAVAAVSNAIREAMEAIPPRVNLRMRRAATDHDSEQILVSEIHNALSELSRADAVAVLEEPI